VPPELALQPGDSRWLEFPEAHSHLYRDGRIVA
jgi:hypothetical protein